MAVVLIKGTYLGSTIKEREFNGEKKSALYIDLYQADSEATNKTVSVKSDDLSLVNKLKDLKMGHPLSAVCLDSGYRNNVYYKLKSLD